jgi:hypothetical protein
MAAMTAQKLCGSGDFFDHSSASSGEFSAELHVPAVNPQFPTPVSD